MKRVSKNFMAIFLSDAASRVLGFAATVYLARVLSVAGFGLISYGMAFLTYALLFANPGLTTIGAREIAKHPDDRRIAYEILGLKLVLALIVLIVFLIGLSVLPGVTITKRVVFFYLLSLLPFSVLLEFVFQGREQMIQVGLARFIQHAVYVILIFVIVRTGDDMTGVPIAYFIGYTVAAVFLLFFFIRTYSSLRIIFSWKKWKSILISSTPVGFATIFNQLSLNLPPLFLGMVYSKADVGLYSAGFKIIMMLLIIERVMHYVFFPVIARQHVKQPEKLKKTFSVITRLLLTIGIPLAIGGAILAEPLIAFIYGAEYSESSVILRILLLYFLITPLNSIYGYGLVAMNRERQFLRIISLISIINAVLICLFGLLLKGPGAAIALFVSEGIGIFLMYRVLRRYVRFKAAAYAIKPFIAALCMGAVLYACIRWHVIVVVLIGACVYVGALFVLRGFTLGELSSVRRSLKQ
jgi:O-antigen/teichoic acid export membrane protein